VVRDTPAATDRQLIEGLCAYAKARQTQAIINKVSVNKV
jgi:hypothetical protein